MPAAITMFFPSARTGHGSLRQTSRAVWTAGLGLLALAASLSPASAQYTASCPPPLKLAAGACVAACPGGYEDRGRECVYRSLSR